MAMTGIDFVSLLLSDYVNENDGLLHVQMGAFARHTQSAIEIGDMKELDRRFALAHVGFRDADAFLKNAFYVSYLVHLDFTGAHGAASQRRMTPLLRAGFTEITDYMAKLFKEPKKPKGRRR